MPLPQTLPASLITAMQTKGYETLTDVQHAVMVKDIQDRDLLVSAQTGSGKTVAFGLAMAATLLAGKARLPAPGAPLALIIAPTRELALQVQGELGWLYAGIGARLARAVGGLDPRAERRALERGAHIVTGTPGRLRDHIERGVLDLSGIRVVTLDEADEMLDFGFREDLEFILNTAPDTRRTLLFSATISSEIARIAETCQKNARRISTLNATPQHADITYLAHTVAGRDREKAVINVLRFHAAPRALVFCATRDGVNRLTAKLHNRGFHAVALSGELTQAERTKALQALRDGRASVCVATDVAARGIDLPGLDLVVHADPPASAENLLHRSGRTGRAGAKGVSVLVATGSRKKQIIRLLRQAQVEAEWIAAPGVDQVRKKDRARLIHHPAFSGKPDQDKRVEAQSLIREFGAERLALAFLSELERRLPAPEELDPTPKTRTGDDKTGRSRRRNRSEFKNSPWFEVNLGRKQRAEPRWLTPILCRVGGVTGKDIGAIHIGATATRFQIANDKVKGFMDAIGRPRDHDNTVHVTVAGDESFEDSPNFNPGGPAKNRSSTRGKSRRTSRQGEAESPAKRQDRNDNLSGKTRPDTHKATPGDRKPWFKADRTGDRLHTKGGRSGSRTSGGGGAGSRRARRKGGD